MQRASSLGPAAGFQRLFWLVPASFLLGVSGTDLPAAVGAAALVGVAWQVVFRRPLLRRLSTLAAGAAVAALLTRSGIGDWSDRTVVAVAIAVLAISLVGTEGALRLLDRFRADRVDGTVPAGT